MGRCTVLKGIHQETKLLLCTLLSEAEGMEHPILKLGVVDSDRAATHFDTIDHHIVGVGSHLTGIGLQQRDVLLHRHGEGVVHRHIAPLLLAPLEEREVDHPEALEVHRVHKALTAAHLETETSQLSPTLHRIITTEDQDQVTRLCLHGIAQGSSLLLGVELIDTALDAAILVDARIDQSLGTHLRALHVVSQLIELLAGIAGTALDTDTTDVGSLIEDPKSGLGDRLLELHDPHVEAHIRLIRAVVLHRILPVHLEVRLRLLNAEDLLE